MADELNTPNHRYYQLRNHIKLPEIDMSKQWIYASGIRKIDAKIINPLFALAEPGVWYDPSDLTTLFQDSAGTTPVTAPGQTVGLMLDKSQGLVLGSELRGSGAIGLVGTATAATYNTTTGVGTVTRVDASNQSFVQWTGLTTAYSKITVSCTSGVAITVRAGTYTGSGTVVVSGQAITFYSLVSGGTITITSSNATSGFTVTSIKEAFGNHATQATSTQRPTYGINPITGTRNLLTRTEEFDNAAWFKDAATISVNAITAPDGTLTADKLVENTANTTHDMYALPATQPIATFTYSLYVKTSGRTKFRLQQNSTTAYAVLFDLVAMTVTPIAGGAVGIITNAGNGWYRCSITYTTTVSFAPVLTLYLADAAGSISYTGDGTSGIYIWGAQLELGSTATAYQKVVSQYEVTEAGVQSASHLAFDGVDDGMVTNTIDPSAGVTPGPELVTNGTFATNVNGWTFDATATNTSTPGVLSGTTGPSSNLLAHQMVTTIVGRTYTCVILTGGASTAVYVSPSTPGGLTLGSTGFATNGTRTLTFVATSTTTYLSVMSVGAASNAVLDNISVRDIVADKVQVFAGVRKLSDAVRGVVAEMSASIAGNAGVFTLITSSSSGPNYTFSSKGTVQTDNTVSTYTAPITNVVTALGDISGASSLVRVNGSQVGSVLTTQGTGNFLAYPLYIGRRGGSSLPYNGRLYSLITRFGANLTTGQITSTESWVNAKTGAY